MRIAIPYEDGSIFPHFGKSTHFKIYEVEEGKVLSSVLLSSEGKRHEELAQLIEKWDIDVVLCGRIGPGMVGFISALDIELYPGCEGDADEALEAFLNGEFSSIAEEDAQSVCTYRA